MTERPPRKPFNQQVADFTDLAVKTAVDMMKGHETFVGAEKMRERLEICNDCEEYNHPLPTQCRVCNCFMPMKTRLKRAECPKGIWGPEEV